MGKKLPGIANQWHVTLHIAVPRALCHGARANGQRKPRQEQILLPGQLSSWRNLLLSCLQEVSLPALFAVFQLSVLQNCGISVECKE